MKLELTMEVTVSWSNRAQAQMIEPDHDGDLLLKRLANAVPAGRKRLTVSLEDVEERPE
jgi:Mg-chelatase subunit ChlI